MTASCKEGYRMGRVSNRLRTPLFNGFARYRVSRAFSCSSRVHNIISPKARDRTHDFEKRVAQLEGQRSLAECYPRLPSDFYRNRWNIKRYKEEYEHLEPNETFIGDFSRDPVNYERLPAVVAGRINSVRTASSKLVFLDVTDGKEEAQAVCQLSKLDGAGVTGDQLKSFAKTVRRGDWYSVIGWPHRTARGELSILATELPQLLSPSLHQIPETLDDAETRARNRHVEMLVNPPSIQPLLVRHQIEKHLNAYFDKLEFIKVNTPLLTAGAGGAVARPFETEATELEGQKLNLRIAPELWLKRLVVGGMKKVYEIGPAFRNEGVDATHNPEFSICEFYEVFATLETVMERTQMLLRGMQEAIDALRSSRLKGLPALEVDFYREFDRIDFIPALEREMQCTLPDLTAASAQDQILDQFKFKNIGIPSRPTLPRLLDALASHYLEPLCHQPTFILNHPACLSPLSKHFTHPTTSQTVAARAELFIKGREYANMYEEENSPFEQRRKFEEQLKFRAVDGEADLTGEVDESYLEALEWGLPPTGGWGCGLDRLVMLFSGRERMSDVLSFGSLRNVVGLGRGRR